MMNILHLSECNLDLSEGSIIVLASFPNISWKVCNGKYRYENANHTGWYLKAIGRKRIMPLDKSTLDILHVISGDAMNFDKHEVLNVISNPESNSKNAPPEYITPYGGIKLTTQLYRELKSAVIVIDDMQALADLDTEGLGEGKIVRVNDSGDGTPVWKKWSSDTEEWVDIFIEINLVTKIDENSTHNQAPSALAVYNHVPKWQIIE